MPGLDMLKDRDRRAVDYFCETVRRSLGEDVLGMKLFGSKACGTDVPGSDIDVLVIVRERTPALVDRIIDIAFETNLAFDVYISPRVVGLPTLIDPVWRWTPFLQSVEREGITL